jgi:hypothetical protein
MSDHRSGETIYCSQVYEDISFCARQNHSRIYGHGMVDMLMNKRVVRTLF